MNGFQPLSVLEENFIERGDVGKIGSAFKRPKMEILGDKKGGEEAVINKHVTGRFGSKLTIMLNMHPYKGS